MNKTVHVIISGRVQGVGYRAWTSSRARHFGIDGWVRNRKDGTVEALFSGAPQTVDALLKECADGPIAAKVSGVEAKPENQAPASGFQQLPTV